MCPLVMKSGLEAVKKGAEIIRSGGVVIYPTDTLYGLGCDALNKDAIARIFNIKHRDPGNPLSIAVSGLRMIKKYTNLGDREMKVLECFLPGPVTFLLKKRLLPDELTGGSDKVGVRVPENWTALKLVIESGVPIVSTSVNVSGMKPITNVDEGMEYFDVVDLIIKEGVLPGPGSTIVDLTMDPPIILREGMKPSGEIVSKIQEVYDLF